MPMRAREIVKRPAVPDRRYSPLRPSLRPAAFEPPGRRPPIAERGGTGDRHDQPRLGDRVRGLRPRRSRPCDPLAQAVREPARQRPARDARDTSSRANRVARGRISRSSRTSRMAQPCAFRLRVTPECPQRGSNPPANRHLPVCEGGHRGERGGRPGALVLGPGAEFLSDPSVRATPRP